MRHSRICLNVMKNPSIRKTRSSEQLLLQLIRTSYQYFKQKHWGIRCYYLQVSHGSGCGHVYTDGRILCKIHDDPSQHRDVSILGRRKLFPEVFQAFYRLRTPSPSHNTSTSPMSFWGYPISIPYFHWSHVLSGGGYPSDWSQVPSWEIPQSQVGGGGQDRVPPGQNRMGYPSWLSQDR